MKILVLGGGGGQLELIKYLKSMGHEVVVVSPYENDPGISHSDLFINENIWNFESIINSVQKLNLDGIVSDQSDVGALAQAHITQQLGLPGEKYSTVERFCNKGSTYENLQLSKKINLPKTHIFTTVNESLAFIKSYPAILSKLIVKPSDSQGSRGVKRLSSHEFAPNDIEAAFCESKSNKILIQEFIDGSHFAVEAYTLNNEVVPLLISKKEKYTLNKNLDKRLVIFTPGNSPDIQLLSDTHNLIVQELGLSNGMTHGEYIVDSNGKVYLIEIAARGAGANISGKVINALTGFNPLHLLVNLSLGIKTKPTVGSGYANFAIIHFLDFVVNESNQKLIIKKNIKGLLHLEVFKKKSGSAPIKDSRDRLGYFIVTGSTLLEAEECESNTLKLLKGAATS